MAHLCEPATDLPRYVWVNGAVEDSTEKAARIATDRGLVWIPRSCLGCVNPHTRRVEIRREIAVRKGLFDA